MTDSVYRVYPTQSWRTRTRKRLHFLFLLQRSRPRKCGSSPYRWWGPFTSHGYYCCILYRILTRLCTLNITSIS